MEHSKKLVQHEGLLQDDNEWYAAFNEAINWATAPQLRNLFVTLLTYCNLQDEQIFLIQIGGKCQKTLNII